MSKNNNLEAINAIEAAAFSMSTLMDEFGTSGKKLINIKKLGNMIEDGVYDFVLKTSEYTDAEGVTTVTQAAAITGYLSKEGKLVLQFSFRAEQEQDDTIAFIRWTKALNDLAVKNIVGNTDITEDAINKAGMQVAQIIKAHNGKFDKTTVKEINVPIEGANDQEVALNISLPITNGVPAYDGLHMYRYNVCFTSDEKIRKDAAYEEKQYAKRIEAINADNNLDEDAKKASTAAIVKKASEESRLVGKLKKHVVAEQ